VPAAVEIRKPVVGPGWQTSAESTVKGPMRTVPHGTSCTVSRQGRSRRRTGKSGGDM
jgi:hypothetical protein